MKYVFGTVVSIVILAGVSWATDAPLQPCRATADKTVGAGPLLEMAVFGDSVAWGNGLAEDQDPTPGHKFSALVADWLARTTNHQVRRVVYAHSGAIVRTPDGTPETVQAMDGDVNSPYPTIVEQLPCIAEDQRSDIRLILINGCINDVGAFGLVSPANSPASVTNQTNTFCGTPVEQMLRSAAQMYPRALVIVTGYYPIISAESDIAPFLDFLRQFFPEESKRSLYLFKQSDFQEASEKQKRSAENSHAFYELTNKLMGDAVDRINHEIGSSRLVFVKVPFSAENAFGAPHSYLWPIPTVFSGFDEVYLGRQLPCLNAFAKDPVGFEVCRLDSAAHPNAEGAQVYANEIVKTLADFARQLVSHSGI